MGHKESALPKERAQATLEFALVLPLLMLFVIMVLQLGLIIRTQIILTHSAREGARAAAALLEEELDSSENLSVSEAVQKAEAAARSAIFLAANLDAGRIQVKVSPLGSENFQGDLEGLEVKVSYEERLEFPLVKEIMPTVRLEASINVIK